MNTLRIAVVALVTLVVSGCTSYCETVAKRRAKLERSEAKSPQPHARVVTSLATLNELIDQTVLQWPRTPLSLASFEIDRKVDVGVIALRLSPARPGYIGFDILVGLYNGSEAPLMAFDLQGELQPQFQRDGQKSFMVIGLDGNALASLKPKLGPDAKAKFATFLRRHLPAEVGKVPAPVFEELVDQALGRVVKASYEVLQRALLKRIDEFTRIRIALPPLPIDHVVWDTTGGARPMLSIDLFTTLPVRRGLSEAHPSPPDDGQLAVRISASTAVEISNWGIANGHLPQHYSRSLKPKKNGAYRPVFDWVGGDRPLVVHLFSHQDNCSYLQVVLDPLVYLADDKLSVAAKHREVMETIGSWPLKLGVWLKNLLWSTVSDTKRYLAQAELSIGGQRVEASLTGMRLDSDELHATVEVSITKL